MEIDSQKFINSLRNLKDTVLGNDMELDACLRLCPSSQNYMDRMLEFLSVKILETGCTVEIRDRFPNLLLLIVTKAFPIADDLIAAHDLHQQNCIAFGKLVNFSQDILQYSLQYFSKVASPFARKISSQPPTKKLLSQFRSTDLEIVRCCHSFLKSDSVFFKNQWNWSEFLQLYYNKGCDQQRLYCNYILAMLTNMTKCQLKVLNRNIPSELIISTEMQLIRNPGTDWQLENIADDSVEQNILWNFVSDVVTNVEGVLLTIFDVDNYKFYQSTDGLYDKTVMVESTKINVRSLALGISFGKAICLSGPVGCGKTTLVEYLARQTGRVSIRGSANEADKENSGFQVNQKNVQPVNAKGKQKKKRTATEAENGNNFENGSGEAKLGSKNGFLRIQLGDQTDSKMLLGQYRCTDVPGEFIWQPGVLTQAVMNGYWLLLEDIDLATQDVCIVLTNLLENNYLNVPGFRDCIRIAPGFQLFVSLRNQKLGSHSQQSTFQLLEKYLYIVNILPLTRNELCRMICEIYPKFKTIDERMVDVFLAFSSGCHDNDDAGIRSNEITDVTVEETEVTLSTDTNERPVMHGLSNSNRLVSTRDLLKWCKRSYPTFSGTSADYSFFVFKNAVDLFCSYLPQGPVKTQLMVSIGAKLNVSIGKCESLANDYNPEITQSNDDMTVGRVRLDKRLNILNAIEYKRTANDNDDEDTYVQKKLKLDSSTYLNVYQQNKRKAPTFSFTRLARCILERIGVAVNQNEPILLVGETGVGKTSSVQYLSYQTNHKLIVINMNNQSDVSDLIGGFKPVDLAFVMLPLRTEFEFLFKQTFNPSKNEKFLNNVAICYNRADFAILIKLMLKIVDTVYTKDLGDKSKKQETILQRWSVLKVKLLKLNAQLKNSINISFAFIPGSLVNCIQNGDWVLLDEINLASTETLECLSTILEPEGSVVLLEKGDYVPIKRHPEFRIFACMNPSTDIGKKDLPVGIRNRFTEFFVDELTTIDDLQILIRDYLRSTGIKETKLFGIAKLYRKLRTLAQLDLNDGLGNRPVYSLRTLCRALTICAKNLCGSVERNLYESFCLSFLTQLDPTSHKAVLLLIQEAMLTNVKAVLSQPIPRPAGDQINFEGYWIEAGPKPIQECENYILTGSVKENLKDLARIISIGKLPVLLQGPTSAGKTSLIEYVAKRSGNYCLRINNHEHTDLQEYIGTYTADVSGKLSFKEGVLVQAMRNGYWIILDELNLASSDILEALNRVLDDNRELFIPETQALVRAHPNFMLFATQNPPGLYGGRKTLSRAFKNRFIELHFSEIPRAELEIILEKRCLIPKSYAQKMVKTMSELQVNRKTTVKGSFTLRDLFRWGNRYTYADATLLADKLYDWNQHLVDEGYLTLSAKIRSEFEVEIIETTLFNNFRKKINLINLFELGDETSMVTKSILQAITAHPKFENIVWTFNMRRMAVLTAKALQFSEPVLLVGPTGCGKTTICQILADIAETNLRILNCHMHTEGADFLGGLRPYRGEQQESESTARQLFEWANGPLVLSMLEGTYFLADEISLAEDSVLERLNCILEPERTVLLAEKGGVNENFITAEDVLNNAGEFIIVAHKAFQFLATMNPGGDFGKKELSPALRNRFTEIWCRATDSKEDLVKIAEHSLRNGFAVQSDASTDTIVLDIATIVVDTVYYLKENVDKFNYSIRDVLAWIGYIIKNAHIKFDKTLSITESLVFGLETIFLDSLEMLPHDSYAVIERLREQTLQYLVKDVREKLQQNMQLEVIMSKKGDAVESTSKEFGIRPFFVEKNICNDPPIAGDFMFTAPTTRGNLFRLLSALSLHKSILLEGPPGVGKTSLIENLTSAIGYNIVRINLCEHTDLADLFGTDLPAVDENQFDNPTTDGRAVLGSFVWRDGPLLAALKAPNTWILLDELNLAPQSVLEGLNAVLDHRGEVYIPELNKTFKLGNTTRIFASQNPLKQGGGRKGLPQSFLNRFTKVYLRKLDTEDLHHVVKGKYGWYFEKLAHYFQATGSMNACSFFESSHASIAEAPFNFDLCKRMVAFSEKLDAGIANFEFGYKGGPFEVNLRDILRWCDFLSNGFVVPLQLAKPKAAETFALVLYEKMKLVYYQRMRTDIDKAYIRRAFDEVFLCNADDLERKSQDISVYWTDDAIYMADIRLAQHRDNEPTNGVEQTLQCAVPRTKTATPLLLSAQIEIVKNMAECLMTEKPVILCGPTDSGKTKSVDLLCTLANRNCIVDTIDDSVTGSFQQVDFNRHLEEVSLFIESVLITYLQYFALHSSDSNSSLLIVKLLQAWESYIQILQINISSTQQSSMSEELLLFKKRLQHLDLVFDLLQRTDYPLKEHLDLPTIRDTLKILRHRISNAETLNTGGHFEWVDSKIVKSFKLGQYICLEHVNLCSSAILDRLNPIFEPNGSVLLSEKGVSIDNEPEIVRKHLDFRAFLTLDPKNGEISRAMRNRCIELSIIKETYSNDNLKHIIFVNGVRDMYLINCVLRMHLRCKAVSDFSQFGISHVSKCANLVAENKRMGYADAKALYVSALEVYVRSANTDLLGFGLGFYRNKLKQEIIDEIKLLDRREVPFRYENVVVNSSRLTSLTLIRKQCEPVVTVLRCWLRQEPNMQAVLVDLFSGFTDVPVHHDSSVNVYLLYILYEISSLADADQRRIYLNAILGELALEANADVKVEIERLVRLNQQLHIDVEKILQGVTSNLELPWNSNVYPRLLAHYKETEVPVSLQLKLSALLLSRIMLSDISVQNTTKLSQIDAVTYSKAVQSRLLQDTLSNDLLSNLYPFLCGVQANVDTSLAGITEFTHDQFVDLIVGYLWNNRLQRMSQRQLFANKTVNDTIVDNLTLHFKWMEKHFLKPLAALTTTANNQAFERYHQKLSYYVLTNHHPLNLTRKLFVKTLTNFLPYYEESQINVHEMIRIYQNHVSLIPKYGGAFEHDKLIKRLTALLDPANQILKQNLSEATANGPTVNWLRQLVKPTVTTDGFGDLSGSLEIFFDRIQQLNDEPALLFDLENEFNRFETAYKDDETSVNVQSLIVELLPILEYFALKSANALHSPDHVLNDEYFRRVQSLGINELQIIRTLSSDTYKVCSYLWNKVILLVTNNNERVAFGELMDNLPGDFYKSVSSFDRNLLRKLQSFSLNSISVQSDACYGLLCDGSEVDSGRAVATNGAILTSSGLQMLLDRNGQLKATGLGDLDNWRSTLKTMAQLVWNNIHVLRNEFSFEATDINLSVKYAIKLLVEIEYVIEQCEDLENANYLEFFGDFKKLIGSLSAHTTDCHKYLSSRSFVDFATASTRHEENHRSAMINALIGSIELNILSYLPLLDPVEKNRLKKLYIEEDQRHLQHLLTAYDFMRVTMNHKQLGTEIVRQFHVKIDKLQTREQSLSKKVALRPTECLYGSLVKDINQFLRTCCHPKTLLDLVDAAQTALQATVGTVNIQAINETIKRMDLWISNAEQFQHHTLSKYSAYYRDFLDPIENALVMLKYGMTGLKSSLIRIRDSFCVSSTGIALYSITENDAVAKILENIVEFPNVSGLNVLPPRSAAASKLSADFNQNDPNVATILSKLDQSDAAYFTLIKAKLQEIQNSISIASNINEDIFAEFNVILNMFNGIWQKQEEIRRQKVMDEENLYVTKTRCQTEDEEEVIAKELETMFPNTIDDDFGEFIDTVTLEQNKRKLVTDQQNARKTTTLRDILLNEDIKLICVTFTDIMAKFSRSYYYNPKRVNDKQQRLNNIEYIAAYKEKTRVFQQLYANYSSCLNSRMDDMFYNGLSLTVGISMENYDLLRLNDSPRKSYNFYKDANIAEVLHCTEVLNRIEIRVTAELENFPEHAGLLDINRIIARIRSFPSTSSVVRFNTGFQILNKKVNEWNKLAHRNNTMADLEEEVASHIQRWMKLELQCWRECLVQSYDKVQTKAHRYWFFIYNLLHEYLQSNDAKNVLTCDLTDFRSVEKCFDPSEHDTEEPVIVKHDKLKSKEVINVLKQFIESSNFADFGTRMKIVKAFEQYLHHLDLGELNKRKNVLICILHNLHLYFDQFRGEIEERVKTMRSGVEKKLKDFVKVESYSKYLSYFSQEANIATVHRKLHKFLKEYETLLGQKIAGSVFVLKDNQLADLNVDNDKAKNLRFSKVKHYMVDVKHFLAPSRIIDRYFIDATVVDVSNLELLSKVGKLFSTSRNIVKHAILHSHFPSLIFNLDSLLGDHIDTCDYLRKLEVDRTQEKPKQKVQAKQILQQKRKALSDFYKVMTQLGINYRTGLMESGLTEELTDLKIAPFCVKTMIHEQKRARVDQNIVYLNENIDTYFVKCMYKLKLLQTVLLTPNSELGLQHLERIKGFSVDLYLLVQSQRKTVSNMLRHFNQLKEYMLAIGDLKECLERDTKYLEADSFEQININFAITKANLCRICDVFQQYELLLRCVPSDSDSKLCAMQNSRPINQSSKEFQEIQRHCANVLQSARRTLGEMEKVEHVQFHNYEVISSVQADYNLILLEIEMLAKLVSSDAGNPMVLGKAVVDLLKLLKQGSTKNGTDLAVNEFDNIDAELENTIHSVLFSMQSIYKKYSLQTQQFYDAKEQSFESVDRSVEKTNDDGAPEEPHSELLEDDHLKLKINAELVADLEILSVPKILAKLSNVLLTIRYSHDYVGKLATARKVVGILPILEQYNLLCKFYLIQHIGAHKVSTKMLSIMLTVFVELGAKGFCVPPDLLQDEDGDANEKEEKGSEGFGLEDGTGEKDVSDKLESEDQLDSAKKPGDDKETDDKEDASCKEEKGIDMSEDFDSKLQDMDKKDEKDDDSDQSDEDEDADKQMGETEEGAEKLDDQIWGSDEEKDENEEEEDNMNDEEEGKGSKDEEDIHNDLANKNDDTTQGEDEQEGLDAADNSKDEKKKKEKDIDHLDEPDVGEDQANPYHNELEEPPEPEDIDLGDNFNLDKEDGNDKEDQTEENPFDIDTMKENMEIDEDAEDDDEKADDEENKVDNEGGSDDSDEDETKRDESNVDEKGAEEEEEQQKDEQTDSTCPAPREDEDDPDEEQEADATESEKKKDEEDFQQSKDKASKEENAQSMPDEQNKGSVDQVQNQKPEEESKQQDDMDAQDTGEDKQAIGQAENEESKSGHQGIADTKETKSNEQQNKKKDVQEKKRKQGKTNEERTLGDPEQQEKKQLKTIDKLNESEAKDAEPDAESTPEENEEYQHIREAKKTDKTTLDNATEDQSKQVTHEDEAPEDVGMEEDQPECADDLMETEDIAEEELDNVDKMQSEKLDQKSDKPSKNERKQDEGIEEEPVQVEGANVDTYNVLRAAETSAHCAVDLLHDAALPIEPTTIDQLQMRKMFEIERTANRLVYVTHEDFESWQTIANKMLPNARELCEQLRLILEPTKCTRLKGDYRTGRRINLKKIIPYIASQFRKDKIWLRRTKPAQRDYKITIAIDDSKSMHHNNSKNLTLQAISLVSQALQLLESGRLSIVSFGEAPQIVLNHTDQFDGPKLVNALNFEQNQSRIAELLNFVRVATLEEGSSGSSDNGIFENLLLVLSDGRNIFSEGEQNVRNAVKLARLQRIFIVYIIIDNPENKHSILDIRVPSFSADRKSIAMKSYLDTFPFPYYVIVRDLGQLPLVLSDAMRQWFELVNSEQ